MGGGCVWVAAVRLFILANRRAISPLAAELVGARIGYWLALRIRMFMHEAALHAVARRIDARQDRHRDVVVLLHHDPLRGQHAPGPGTTAQGPAGVREPRLPDHHAFGLHDQPDARP